MSDEEKVETKGNEHDESGGDQPESGSALSDVEKTAMERASAILSDACESVLSKLTGKEAKVSVEEVTLLDLDQEKSRHAGSALLAKLPCDQGELGDVLVLFKEETAPRIAGLMDSGSGEKGIPDDLCAFLARVAEAASPNLSASFGGAVAFGQAQVQQVDWAASKSEFSDRASVRLALKFAGDGTDELVVLVARQAAQKYTDGADGVVVEPAQFSSLTARGQQGGEASSLDMLMDLNLPVSVELGRIRLTIADILKLQQGSVIELDKSAGDPVELFVNDKKFGEGEVVVAHNNYGIRIISLVDGAGRGGRHA